MTLPDGTKIEYAYAADGNIGARSKTPAGGSKTTTHYLVDPNLAFAQVVAEYDDAGKASAEFTYGDELLARNSAGSDSYYEHDGHGSVVVLTDAAAAVVQSYGYDAWGNAVESTGTDDYPYGYAGERTDADTGLIYLRARWYDPTEGRFISSDSARGYDKRPSSHNLYGYAETDPVGRSDSSGYAATAVDEVAATDIMGNLSTIANFGSRLIGAYDKINTLKQLIVGTQELLGYLNGTVPDFSSAFPGPNVPSINYSEAADAYLRLTAEGVRSGLADWLVGFGNSLRVGQKLKAYLIYMPTFGPLPQKDVGTGIKIEGIPVRAVFGGRGGKFGSLGDLGLQMGVNRELLRMDYEPFDEGHGGVLGKQASEINVLRDGVFHMHVYKWNAIGGP